MLLKEGDLNEKKKCIREMNTDELNEVCQEKNGTNV